mmetsp:Transcript_24318/g.61672  ORF Transcript_24318/g.61672 Transcript_24318/m.61672 type:complete len:362 (-) Transcript_24318:42-1127(-)
MDSWACSSDSTRLPNSRTVLATLPISGLSEAAFLSASARTRSSSQSSLPDLLTSSTSFFTTSIFSSISSSFRPSALMLSSRAASRLSMSLKRPSSASPSRPCCPGVPARRAAGPLVMSASPSQRSSSFTTRCTRPAPPTGRPFSSRPSSPSTLARRDSISCWNFSSESAFACSRSSTSLICDVTAAAMLSICSCSFFASELISSRSDAPIDRMASRISSSMLDSLERRKAFWSSKSELRMYVASSRLSESNCISSSVSCASSFCVCTLTPCSNMSLSCCSSRRVFANSSCVMALACKVATWAETASSTVFALSLETLMDASPSAAASGASGSAMERQHAHARLSRWRRADAEGGRAGPGPH